MQCQEIKSLLGAYLNRKLEKSLNSQVSQHLDECHLCQQELNFDKRISKALQAEADIPILSANFNQMVLASTATSRKTLLHKVNSYLFDRPWIVSVLGMVFSLFIFLIYPLTNSFRSLAELFLAFFSFKPLIVALILAISFWIFFANERFLDKLIYPSEDRNGNGTRGMTQD